MHTPLFFHKVCVCSVFVAFCLDMVQVGFQYVFPRWDWAFSQSFRQPVTLGVGAGNGDATTKPHNAERNYRYVGLMWCSSKVLGFYHKDGPGKKCDCTCTVLLVVFLLQEILELSRS